jgi:hypothetical protein
LRPRATARKRVGSTLESIESHKQPGHTTASAVATRITPFGSTFMVHIKGSVVLDTVRAVKTRASEEEYARILELLNPAARKVFEGEIFSSTWYPLDAFMNFLEVEIKVLFNGREEVLVRASEALIENQLQGIYKAFVKAGSPEFIIKRIAAVHATYFQGVSIEVKMEGESKAVLHYVGFEKQHRLQEYTLIGFFRKALEISGAKNVAAEFTTKISAGTGIADLLLTWS